MNISRDQLMEIALKEFIRRYQTRQMLSLDVLNEAYADAPEIWTTSVY